MKRFIIFIAIVFVLGNLSLFASDFIVRIFDNSNFSMLVDGQRFNSLNGYATVNNINGGRHDIEIFKTENRGRESFNNVIYSGVVDVPVDSRIIAEIDRNFNFVIVLNERIRPVSNAPSENHSSVKPHNNHGNNAVNRPNPVSKSRVEPSYGMSHSSFELLVREVSRESFDSNREDVAYYAISNGGISSAQLKELLGLFSFDESRLSLAKKSYNYIVDKNNVFILREAFSFSSNADEFFKFVGLKN